MFWLVPIWEPSEVSTFCLPARCLPTTSSGVCTQRGSNGKTMERRPGNIRSPSRIRRLSSQEIFPGALSPIGPATRCDDAHLRWDVLKHLRCIKITCDVLRCIFQHVGNFSPDFGISLLFIVRFSNGLFGSLRWSFDRFHMINIPTFSVKYF